MPWKKKINILLTIFCLLNLAYSINEPVLSPLREQKFNTTFDCIVPAQNGGKFAVIHKINIVNIEITYFRTTQHSFEKIATQKTHPDGDAIQFDTYEAIWSSDNIIYFFGLS